MAFVKWPSIDKFSDVFHNANRTRVNAVTLRGKIKLHGTNSGIRVENGALIGQKKTSDVSIGDDNAGFAQWLSTVELASPTVLEVDGDRFEGIVLYGEWAGPGCQSGDAVSGIDGKKFFVFSVYDITNDTIYVEPLPIQNYVDAIFAANDDIIVLPWYTEEIVVRMLDQDDAQAFINTATALVDDVIAVQDPYIKEMFNVEGKGEGIVYYALDQGANWRDWMFKVKSDAHTVNKSKNRNHVAPEKPEGMDEFVDMFFTENRFKQILNEALGGVVDRTQTGDFIKAVMIDVFKESVNEIELAEFEWGTVAKYAVTKTRLWYLDQADVLA
jgi:phage pi2 protein 07